MTTQVLRQRPTVLGNDLRRFVNLTWTLAATDFKLRFYGSALGYVWTLARPFLLFGVIYVVFTQIVDIGGEVPYYGVCILTSMMLFQFFAEASGNSVMSLIARENLLRKMRFPRLVIPLSVTLTAIFNLLMTLVAVMIFTIASGVYPRLSWLELPVLLVLLAMLAAGTGMLLSALFVRYRDVAPIWDVMTQILFYASPILYVVSQIPEKFQQVYVMNPLAAIFTQVRHAVIDPSAPSAAAAIGGTALLAIPIGIIVVMFGAGLWFFNREAPRIAENL